MAKRRRRALTCRLMVGLCLSGLWPWGCSATEDGRAPASESILASDLRADLYFLAGDGMRGRLSGTPENALAADFVKSRFERMGLVPAAAGGSFFQPFDLMTFSLGADNGLSISGLEGEPLHFAPGEQYYPMSFSANGVAAGELVYAGFGIRALDVPHDDYSTGVTGKIVLVLEHEPGEHDPESPFDGIVPSAASAAWRKALIAQEAGAEGILFVRDAHNHEEPFEFEVAARNHWPEEPRYLQHLNLASRIERLDIPAARISPEVANRLLAVTGKSLDELTVAAETAGGMPPEPLRGLTLELRSSVDRQRRTDRNVVALLEGSDPRLKDQLVLVCAHYDHDGVEGDQIFNGADDDGSGIVGVIEIAEAFALAAREGHRPRRSILFAAWNTEEWGLFGSWAYTENPLWPLENTAAVLNMDMIGRNEEVPAEGGRRFRGLEPQTAESNSDAVNVLGYSRSPDLRSEVEAANGAIGLELKFRYDDNSSNLLARSDQWPFLQLGVPALFFHTGLHPDYHRPEDRPEAINYQKLERIVRLVYQTSWNVAQSDPRPGFEGGYRFGALP